jgi:anti-sigma factor RsiW
VPVVVLSESLFQKSDIVEAVNHLSIELIERYTLHELSEGEIQEVEEHVALCPECEDRVQDEIESPAAMRSSSVGEIRRMMEAGRKKPARR